MSIRPAFAAALLAFALPALAADQQAPPAHGHGHHDTKAGAAAGHDCEAMMARHQEMQAKVQEADAELDRLVAAMTAAEGDAKVDATAAVVAELVAQRKSMMTMMHKQMPMMMGHMMNHGGHDGMASCPMMKHMQGEPAVAPPAD